MKKAGIMAYQALYRRWRPSGFDGIVGQDAVVKTLKNQIKADRIGHAYLFCGTRGTGKTSAAKIFARAVNCPHAKEHDGSPCNECDTCKAISSGRALNVFEIDAASNNGVDNIRDIREQVEYPPVTGRYKVYIIDEVHMLSTGAFNALLKTLEEPPAYVIFILATTDPQKLPATILSRCQRYDFRRITKGQITEHLRDIVGREDAKVEDKALAYIAEAADGSMRDALSILDQCLAYHYGEGLTYANVLDILGAADDSIYSELYGKILNSDTEGCLEQTARLINEGCEPTRLVNDLIMYLRNVLLVRSMGNNELLELSEERYERMKRDASLAGNDTLIRIILALSELANRTRFSTQKRTALEVELIRLCNGGAKGVQATAEDAAAVHFNAASSVPSPQLRAAQAATVSPHSRVSAGELSAQDIPTRSTDLEAYNDAISHAASAKISVSLKDLSATEERGADTHLHETPEPAHSAQDASGSLSDICDKLRKNWSLLTSDLSSSNRPLFNGVLIKEENGRIALVFGNQINYRMAAKSPENGLAKLRDLAQEKLGISVTFTARAAKPGEINMERPRATQEELAKINFPISIED